MRSAALPGLVVVLLGLGACTTRADKALCERAADNLVTVSVQAKVAKAQGEGRAVDVSAAREAAVVDAKEPRARFMSACTSSSRETVECIEQARDLKALQACQNR